MSYRVTFKKAEDERGLAHFTRDIASDDPVDSIQRGLDLLQMAHPVDAEEYRMTACIFIERKPAVAAIGGRPA